jgi:hypothetical protein
VSDLAAQLQALESELHSPATRVSREQLEKLIHPEFREVGRSGRQYTREAVIAHLAAEEAQLELVAKNYAAKTLGPGVALLTYESAHRNQDGTLCLAALRSSVWVHSESGWKLVYHQGTPAPEA